MKTNKTNSINALIESPSGKIKPDNFRKYGRSPYSIALIHGGPGANGEMAPLAGELSKSRSILEVLQKGPSIVSLIDQMQSIFSTEASLPITLIGHSWGAWLSFLYTASNPGRVKKLILVGSAPFAEKDASGIMETRLKRLRSDKRNKIINILNALNEPAIKNKKEHYTLLLHLLSAADHYDPFHGYEKEENIDFQIDSYLNIWQEASLLRQSGELLTLGRKIDCPVTAIHGDYDPHPSDGVKIPLSGIIKDFKFILLKNCGHKPWIERQAKEEFYKTLLDEIK